MFALPGIGLFPTRRSVLETEPVVVIKSEDPVASDDVVRPCVEVLSDLGDEVAPIASVVRRHVNAVQVKLRTRGSCEFDPEKPARNDFKGHAGSKGTGKPVSDKDTEHVNILHHVLSSLQKGESDDSDSSDSEGL